MSPASPIPPSSVPPACPPAFFPPKAPTQLMRPDSCMQPKGHTSPWTWRRVCINQAYGLRGGPESGCMDGAGNSGHQNAFLLEKRNGWWAGWWEAYQVQVWSPGEAAGEISGAWWENVWDAALGYLDSITEQSVERRCWRWERILKQERGDCGYSSRRGFWWSYVFIFQRTLVLLVVLVQTAVIICHRLGGLNSEPSFHRKNRCWGWTSNTLATCCKESTHWKSPWCWKVRRKMEKGMAEDEMVR